MSLDQLLVLTSVACAAAYMLLRRFRSTKKTACSGGCNCDAAKTISPKIHKPKASDS